MRQLATWLFVFLIGYAATGCGGSDSLNQPVVPSPADNSVNTLAHLPDTSGHYLWTYRDILIDPVSLEYEILPNRAAEGHWNVLSWLEGGPCTGCFGIAGITPSGSGTLLIDIAVSHPFPSASLTGFDVRGIPMFNGTMSFPESGLTWSDRMSGDGELVNADGYTSLYNPTTIGSGPSGLQGYIEGRLARSVPDATLNGYKRHVSDNPANTRNAFYAGDSVTVMYEIDMPDGPFVFGYAVDGNWAPPITSPVEDPMTDFGSDANCPEPWKIEVIEIPVGNGLTDLGGSTVLSIDVYSHVAGPFTVIAEAPGLFSGEITTDTSTGTGDGFTTYELIVENTLTASAGEYRLLLSAVNQNNPAVPEWIDLTAYSIVPLRVNTSVKLDPVAQAMADPMIQEAGQAISFSDNGSYDPDGGSIVGYEWDWDNDGTFDQTGASVNHTFDTAGMYSVQYRVTDDEGATDTLDTPLAITITEPKVAPVAQAAADPTTQEAGFPISFSDNGSYDPDGGLIVNYEWDWDNNGTFDQTGASVNHTFDMAGTYNVQFRVTDDEGATDVLDTPLVITITPAQTGYTWDGEIEAILHSTCSPCHVNNSSGGVNLTTYQTMLDSDVVVPGQPMSSKLYTEIYQGKHLATPTSGELDMIYQWIEDGALEN